jgi:hypothetical protein
MKTLDLARQNPAGLACQLHALGFTPPGAQQLLAGQVVSDLHDRQRLALLLTRLLGSRAIEVVGAGAQAAIKSGSGVIVDFTDDA